MTDVLAEFNEEAPAPAEAPKKVIVGNTVNGVAEATFRRAWIAILSHAMLKSGRGFRVDSPKRRQPKGAAMYRGERREDKVGSTKVSRALLAGGSR